MEQKEKIEKPRWIELVETLPELVRQQVGTTCAGTISALVQIGLIDYDLYNQVWMEAHRVLKSYLNVCEDAKSFVDEIVKDAMKDENV